MSTITFLYDSILDVGGVENHLLSILKKSDQKKNRFIIISNVSEIFYEKTIGLGVEIINLNQKHPLNPLIPIRIARIIRQKEVNLVHAHSPTASLWGRVASYLSKIPCIMTVHLPVEHYHGSLTTLRASWGRKVYSSLNQWLNFRKGITQKIIYVSEEVYNQEILNGHSPAAISTLIPNGIDFNRFSQIDRIVTRRQFDLNPKTKVIIFVGRLESQKNIGVLINAVSSIKLPDMDFRLWIVGDGPLTEELKRLTQSVGLWDRVDFWGYQKDVDLFLAASDIFVLPSYYEGLPYSLLEGMAAGLPCIVANVGEMKNLVKHGDNGFVVSPDDSISLTEALNSLLTEPDLYKRMAKNVWKQAQRFSDNEMVKRIEKVYNECLEGLSNQ